MATIPISDGDPKNTYVATSGQTTFPYTFWAREADHIAVFVNGTLQTLSTDYTVSAVQETSGANIVFNSGLAEDDSVVIVYLPDFERLSEYTGTIRLDALNTELTYIITLLQSNQRKIDDAIRLADEDASTSFSGTLPSLSGNGEKVLRLKSDETTLEFGPSSTDIENAATNAASAIAAATDAETAQTAAEAAETGALAAQAAAEAAIGAVKVSADDTTPGVLDGKLVAGDAVGLTVGSPAGDETLSVGVTDGGITNAKLADMATNRIKGRVSGGTGDPEDLTALQARGVMSVYSEAEVDALLAAVPFSSSYESGEQTITTSTEVVLTHGLGSQPEIIRGELVCKTAEYGYSIGDIIPVALTYLGNYSPAATVGCVVENSTQIKVRFGIGGFPILRKDTYGTQIATPANWRLVVKAWA